MGVEIMERPSHWDNPEYQRAVKKLPRCVAGNYDPHYHKTPADLAFMVLIQMDIYEAEPENSDIRNKAEYGRCQRYVATWQDVGGRSH